MDGCPECTSKADGNECQGGREGKRSEVAAVNERSCDATLCQVLDVRVVVWFAVGSGPKRKAAFCLPHLSGIRVNDRIIRRPVHLLHSALGIYFGFRVDPSLLGRLCGFDWSS